MRSSILAGLGIAMLTAGSSQAHFELMTPAASLVQDRLGDPQKLAPCGGTSANPGTPTNSVTAVRGGDMLPVKLRETIYHPGHYRIALARTQADLPPDPEAETRDTPKGVYSVSAKIAEAKPPILADGLFPHTQKPAADALWETTVRVPNIDCDSCVLQVVQFMSEARHNKDGDFSYHHCAILKITANPALPVDKSWPAK